MQEQTFRRNLPQRYRALNNIGSKCEDDVIPGDTGEIIYLQDEIDDLKEILGLTNHLFDQYNSNDRTPLYQGHSEGELALLRADIEYIKQKLGDLYNYPTVDSYITSQVINEVSIIKSTYDTKIEKLEKTINEINTILKPKLHTFKGFNLRSKTNGRQNTSID